MQIKNYLIQSHFLHLHHSGPSPDWDSHHPVDPAWGLHPVKFTLQYWQCLESSTSSAIARWCVLWIVWRRFGRIPWPAKTIDCWDGIGPQLIQTIVMHATILFWPFEVVWLLELSERQLTMGLDHGSMANSGMKRLVILHHSLLLIPSKARDRTFPYIVFRK